MKGSVRKHVPREVWQKLAVMKNLLLDSADYILGRRDELVPPRRLVFIGGGDFRKVGNEFLSYFKELAQLQQDESVLDVGCGIGRMAIPLTEYLSEQASYEGFDIVPHGIRWCSDHITPRYPRFRFQLADICNKEYNPSGRFGASEYRFPYENHSFSFVFLTSVFTHMLPNEVTNYLAEVQRVLKPKGRCLITWFLLNSESEMLIQQGRASLDFRYTVGECLTTNPAIPEDAICYKEEHVLRLYKESGLTLQLPVHYGSWCQRERYLSYQDICIARKRP
jgi:SAM-dependent methyltransferase